jgi:glycosyltransferase involved in cell wall biosynthesis
LKNKKITYLGFNNFKTHKRGVENVIYSQNIASPYKLNYYLHWDSVSKVCHYENLICIGIKKNIFWFIYLNIILFKLKKRDKYLFIHSHNALMSIISIYNTHLFTVHDALYYLMSATKNRYTIIFWFLEKFLYTRCHYVHFISEYSKKMSLYRYNKNYEIIYNTTPFEKQVCNNTFNYKTHIKFPTDAFKVFLVRSIEERALINLIIEVAEKIKNKKIQIFIAGKGPLLDFYRLKIKELALSNIVLLGYVSDIELKQYYIECDLVVVPAAYGEGFGLPIIEGYLFNKPVIASNVCAIPEVIHSKSFLFENTVESIVSKLFLASVPTCFNFQNYYQNLFSNKLICLKINGLYKKLV